MLLAAGLLAPALLGAAARAADDPPPVVETPWAADGLAGTLACPARGAVPDEAQSASDAAGAGGPRPGPADGSAPKPGILIIAGSGPTDRDGNGPGLATDLYRKLAHGLAAAGHCVLRYDKRGVGARRAGAPAETELRFDHLVRDAGIAFAGLAARPQVRGAALLGHSEGALIATLLAPQVKPDALILLAAPGRPLGAVLGAQFAAAPMPGPLRQTALDILAALEAGRPVAAVPPELAPLFRPSVQPYLMSQLGIDPAAALAVARVPVLLVGAGRDLQTGPAEFDRLAAARPDATVLRLKAANHILVPAPEDRAGNIALYGRPETPLDPALLPALTGFLDRLP